jgi:hypothetical protein
MGGNQTHNPLTDERHILAVAVLLSGEEVRRRSGTAAENRRKDQSKQTLHVILVFGIQNQKQNSQRNINHQVCFETKEKDNLSLRLYDGNGSSPPSFTTPPYLSKVAVNLSFFATRQASSTFTESPNCLNLKTSTFWTASTTVVTGIPGCHVRQ